MIAPGGTVIDPTIVLGCALVTAAALVATIALVIRVLTLQKANRRLRLLGEVSAEVNRAILLNEEGDRIFSTILDYALRILDGAKLGSVLALDEMGFLTIVAGQGFTDDYRDGFRIRLEDTWQYRQTGGRVHEPVIITPETILRSGYKHDDWTWEYRSVISAPLHVGDRLYGMVNIDSHRERNFGPQDLAVMRRFQSQIEVCLLARERYRTTLADSRLDGLTRFLNRVSFEQQMEVALDHAARYGETVTVGMFDVDGLKAVNDQHGHTAGDKLLRSVADALRLTARKSDVLGRFGGDEFVAVYRNTDPRSMIERAAQTLGHLKATPVDLGNAWVTASFSYGFAEYPAEGGSPEALITAADRRLYDMKSGRART
jgi:diguanylate cyclase (GGDEF)-like protein